MFPPIVSELMLLYETRRRELIAASEPFRFPGQVAAVWRASKNSLAWLQRATGVALVRLGERLQRASRTADAEATASHSSAAPSVR